MESLRRARLCQAAGHGDAPAGVLPALPKVSHGLCAAFLRPDAESMCLQGKTISTSSTTHVHTGACPRSRHHHRTLTPRISQLARGQVGDVPCDRDCNAHDHQCCDRGVDAHRVLRRVGRERAGARRDPGVACDDRVRRVHPRRRDTRSIGARSCARDTLIMID